MLTPQQLESFYFKMAFEIQVTVTNKRGEEADIGKTFEPLPNRRTGNHMENPSFTGPPKLLQDLFFFLH